MSASFFKPLHLHHNHLYSGSVL